ncbi:BLUF domain-containing protein [Hymenobacter sp. 102]|uniref:BLUF domain-containing protein n=1 Tax=Hymenobacter sp. 102 TaxID=3403152 RepID=UPI003CF153E8
MSVLHHLIYQSTAVTPFSAAELERLLSQSRPHNAAAGITGILLYDGNRFMQVLEGAPEAVEATFGRIRNDCRHTEVQVLANGPIGQRQFGEWLMSFITYIKCPEIGFGDSPPVALTLSDASLCMLLHDFQRNAGKIFHSQLY